MTTEPDKVLHPIGVKLSEIGALRDVWHGAEEREAWVNAPLSIVLDLVDAARAADAEEIARLRQDVANRDSRLRADIELMNIAGIDGLGAEKALADHDAELLRRAERAELLNQITQQEFRATGAVRAERDALAQQIAAVRAVADGITYSSSAGDLRRDLDDILASPVTPESETNR